MNGVWWTIGVALLICLLRIIHRTCVATQVSQNQEEATFCPIPSYKIELRDGFPTITCLRCDMTSWHPKDVQHLYCGNCHEFHIQATLTTKE